MNELTVEKKDNSMVEFEPFGSKDKVKLSISIVRRLVAVKTKTGKVPDDDQCLKFIAMCQAQRANPFAGDAYFIGYDTKDGAQFSMITAHQAFLKRAELHPEFDGMESGIIVKQEGVITERQGDFHEPGETVLGGWAKVFFKKRSHPMYKRVRMDRFKKSFGVWLDDAAGMICKCAEADALRSAFPTMLGGMYLREEIDADPGPAKISAPIFDVSPAENQDPVQGQSEQPVASATQTSELKQTLAASNLLQLIRVSCRAAGIKETELLGYLVKNKVIDEAVDSLEAMAMVAPSKLQYIVDNWVDLLEELHA